ncbi:MAG: toll/interleukin-1 receptor domain-containing protein [Oscillospiraceae bacterium]|nr:toll/interleukin-1 receptor domain-containing protein [Oscillospiraceae bacterium]
MANQVNYSDKYDVFLSYRREGGEMMAIILHDRLTAKGYRVFLDIESLTNGKFNKKLLTVIEGCTDFIVVLSPNSLERCKNEGDWVRNEIAHAFQHEKNIVPVMLHGFEWPKNPEDLPEDMEELPLQNGLRNNDIEYLDDMINRLCNKFLESQPQGPAIKKPKQPKAKKTFTKKTKGILAAAVALVVVVGAVFGGMAIWRNNDGADVPVSLANGEDVSSGLTSQGSESSGLSPVASSTENNKQDTTAKQPVGSSQSNVEGDKSFLQLLSQVKEKDECVVYVGDVDIVLKGYTVFLFYSTGIVVQPTGQQSATTEISSEAIEGIINWTNEQQGGYPDISNAGKGLVHMGTYALENRSIEFSIINLHDGAKETLNGTFDDYGNLKYKSGGYNYTVKPYGVFIDGKIIRN